MGSSVVGRTKKSPLSFSIDTLSHLVRRSGERPHLRVHRSHASPTPEPRYAVDWATLDDYFYARRYWIVGLLIGANLGHVALELPAMAPLFQAERSVLLRYLVANFVLFGAYLTLLVAKTRWLSVTAMAVFRQFLRLQNRLTRKRRSSRTAPGS